MTVEPRFLLIRHQSSKPGFDYKTVDGLDAALYTDCQIPTKLCLTPDNEILVCVGLGDLSSSKYTNIRDTVENIIKKFFDDSKFEDIFTTWLTM